MRTEREKRKEKREKRKEKGFRSVQWKKYKTKQKQNKNKNKTNEFYNNILSRWWINQNKKKTENC